MRQTNSDSGSSTHIPSMYLGKLQPNEATSTNGQHSTEAHGMCFKAVLVGSADCRDAAQCPAPASQSHSGLAGCVKVPHELGGGASCSLHGTDEENGYGMMPQSHALNEGPPESDLQHCNRAISDSSSNSLQHNCPSQGEHASFASRNLHGHEAHECCQHETYQPGARACARHEPGMRSSSAAASRGHSSKKERPPCSNRAAENDTVYTPGSSSSSLGRFVTAAEQGAPIRVRSRSSMVFEVA